MSMGHNIFAKIRDAVSRGYRLILNSGDTLAITGNLSVTGSVTAASIVGGGAPGAALTAQLTTLTPADAEGTPDYATAALTQTTPYGFVAAQEGITVLYIIKNLQVRLAEVESRLEVAGIVTAN